MKQIIFACFLIITALGCKNEATPSNTTTEKPTKKKPLSPPATAMAMVGDAHIHIEYSSPGVRGRTIFGELIPYGKLWRAGANNATSIESNKDLIINGATLPAGKYGFFVIPNQEKWILIFNTRWNEHGTDKYKEAEDVLRVEVIPNKIENLQEHLEYQVSKSDEESGLISLKWEKTLVELPFKVINH